MPRPVIPIVVLGGALLGAAYSIEWAWLAAFVGVAVFAWTLERATSLRDAAFLGVGFGWTGYVGGFFWLQPALESFWNGNVALAWAVWIAWGFWVALRFVAVALLHRTLRKRGVGALLSLTLPWSAIEWLYPAVFPFYLANPLVDLTWIAQGAALGGPILVSAWACTIAVALAESVRSSARHGSTPVVEWAVVLVATLLLVVYGSITADHIERRANDAPALRVGIVQANVDVMEKRSERALSHRRHLEQSRALLSASEVDVLIWPETSYLYPLPRELPISGESVVDDLDVPLVFGGIRRGTDGSRFNSALSVDTSGVIRSAYDKRHLIPFAEFVPLGDRFAWWGNAAPSLSRFSKGTGAFSVDLGGRPVATPICYETIRPGYVRKLVHESDAQLLVSLTNDGWFGDSPEPHIHLRLARFRAIEQRRFLVRATNTGISAIVDPLGRVVTRSPLFRTAAVAGEVRMLEAPTLYRALGDWPGVAGTLAVLLLIAVKKRR